MTQHRSPQEVLDDHLRESQDGSIEDDLARNYSEALVVLTGRGVYRGHNGLRQLAKFLRNELPEGRFEYRTRLVEGEMVSWSGPGTPPWRRWTTARTAI